MVPDAFEELMVTGMECEKKEKVALMKKTAELASSPPTVCRTRAGSLAYSEMESVRERAVVATAREDAVAAAAMAVAGRKAAAKEVVA